MSEQEWFKASATIPVSDVVMYDFVKPGAVAAAVNDMLDPKVRDERWEMVVTTSRSASGMFSWPYRRSLKIDTAFDVEPLPLWAAGERLCRRVRAVPGLVRASAARKLIGAADRLDNGVLYDVSEERGARW